MIYDKVTVDHIADNGSAVVTCRFTRYTQAS